MTTETLIVDDGRLAAAGGRLQTLAASIPDAPAPFSVSAGSDRLSETIASQIPEAEAPAINGLPPLKQSAKTTADNIVQAAVRYAQTDAELAAAYERHQFDSPAGPSGGGGASATGGGGGGSAAAAGLGSGGALAGAPAAGAQGNPLAQLGQMMGMPLQMAGQAAQIPMQAMGMAGSIPQGAMQGVQSAVQQVGQLSGQLDKSSEEKPAVNEKPADRPSEAERDEGGAPGQSGAERAPAPRSNLHDATINL